MTMKKNNFKLIFIFSFLVLGGIFFTNQKALATVPGPAAYWKFDEGAGGATRLDAVGSSNLTDHGGVVSGPGKINNAGYFFSASSMYVSAADSATLSTGDIDFTVSAWVMMDSKTNTMTIMGKRATGSSGEYTLVYDNSSDRFVFFILDAGGGSDIVYANNLGSPSTDTWYLVTGWRDKTAGTINIQVNNGTVNSLSTSRVVADTTAQFNIGAQMNGSNYYLSGKVDEAGFWKTTLTAAQRTELYNGGSGWIYTPPPATCASYPNGATPDGDTTSATTGVRLTSVNGVSSQVTQVLVYQWSEVNGQDDLVGYFAANQGSGTWHYNLPLDAHTELGNILVHVYIYDPSYGWLWCDTASFIRVAPPQPSCTSATPDGDWTIDNSGTVSAFANGVSNSAQVWFITWSGTTQAEQDDIVFYNGANQGGGTWKADINLASHPGLGTISSYVYLVDASSNWSLCDIASFTRLNNGTINVNSSTPTSWTITCPLTNAACPNVSSGANQTTGSYPSKPYSTWTLTPADVPGYDWQVTGCALNTPCGQVFQ